ncbi:hypothetical protein [Rhizobium terrae]|uniref:hypothetical protein n=1 Tax=Rhizobium terrae TaxID=2171756 RepID=UPI000E3EACCE|nr:hypothetical protein [Rhizobium terrae]
MLAEAIQHAATSVITPKEFRPFVRSSVSLWSRAGRCAKEWAPHEENCKSFIREAIAGIRERRTAVVLGSGLLRDVPIGALAGAFDTVVLVDVVHLASIRAWLKAKRFRNIRLISRDLSGFDEALSGKAPEPLAFLRQVPYLDLVVSANILSQIGVGAKRRLEQEKNPKSDEILQRLIRAHLDGLAALPCKVALLTDTAYKVADRHGNVTEEADLLRGVPAPQAKRCWKWPVAPYGELGKDVQAIHDVIAM